MQDQQDNRGPGSAVTRRNGPAPAPAPAPDGHDQGLTRCLSLDLEVGRADDRIHALAGVRPDTGQVGRNVAQAQALLEELSDGADFLLGHNLIDFDLPHLRAANPGLRLLDLPAVDTLRLNPLAFPRNHYHHLVKDYQDGSLIRGRLNDPELDARLVLEVFDNQQRAFRETGPELLTAWHWLTTTDGGAGFDLLFSSVRQTARPSTSETQAAIQQCLTGNGCRVQARQAVEDAAQQGWEMANEEFTGVWHLRETRALVDWLRGRDSRLVSNARLEAWLAGQAPNPWTEMLGEAVAGYALETVAFHTRVGKEEDADAPRRLYYVGMTRARQTLALMRLPGPNPFQDALSNAPCTLFRSGPAALPAPAPELARSYRRFSLGDVFISFAGSRRPGHPVHTAIAALSPGDPLQVRAGSGRWELLDRDGVVVGQLARNFKPPPGMNVANTPVSWPLSGGIGSGRNPSSRQTFAPIPGRWSCRNWSFSRMGRCWSRCPVRCPLYQGIGHCVAPVQRLGVQISVAGAARRATCRAGRT